jgi:hypothetical protein
VSRFMAAVVPHGQITVLVQKLAPLVVNSASTRTAGSCH